MVPQQQLLDPPEDVPGVRRAARELPDLGVELLRPVERAIDAEHDRPRREAPQGGLAVVRAVDHEDVGIEPLLQEARGFAPVGHRSDVVARLPEPAVQVASEIVLRLDQEDPSGPHHRPFLPSSAHRQGEHRDLSAASVAV